MSLKDLIARMIAADGPMPLDRYMSLCLTHPEHGYYTKGRVIGAEGDFTTAPEISQMFGELVGAWIVTMWRASGAPDLFYLVELGPGRGVLYADMLRVLARDPECLHAARGVMVEASPALTDIQQRRLAAAAIPLQWTTGLDGMPHDAPWFLVANEFFDALPVRHLVKGPRGWHERCIVTAEDGLAWGVSAGLVSPAMVPAQLRDAPQNSVVEVSPARAGAMREVADHIAQKGGAALIVDYGYERQQLGETFQAMARHQFADPLAAPGEADLTAHVDITALAEACGAAGVWVPIAQGQFLQRLGIEARAARLKLAAPAQQAAEIDAALTRLTHGSAMGDLFKVLAVCQKGAAPPPGFAA